MKTTLEIPDELFQRAKKVALERRTSFKSVVIEALEQTLGPDTQVVSPIRTHVWPPENVSKSTIESESILQMIRHERDGSGHSANNCDQPEHDRQRKIPKPVKKMNKN